MSNRGRRDSTWDGLRLWEYRINSDPPYVPNNSEAEGRMNSVAVRFLRFMSPSHSVFTVRIRK